MCRSPSDATERQRTRTNDERDHCDHAASTLPQLRQTARWPLRQSRKPLSVLTADRGFKSLPLRLPSRLPRVMRVCGCLVRRDRSGPDIRWKPPESADAGQRLARIWRADGRCSAKTSNLVGIGEGAVERPYNVIAGRVCPGRPRSPRVERPKGRAGTSVPTQAGRGAQELSRAARAIRVSHWSMRGRAPICSNSARAWRRAWSAVGSPVWVWQRPCARRACA